MKRLTGRAWGAAQQGHAGPVDWTGAMVDTEIRATLANLGGAT